MENQGGRGLVLVVVSLVAACGGTHVKLLFPTQSESADRFECNLTDGEGVATTEYNCHEPRVVDRTIENQSGTTRIDVIECAEGLRHQSITILDASTDSPRARIVCAGEGRAESILCSQADENVSAEERVAQCSHESLPPNGTSSSVQAGVAIRIHAADKEIGFEIPRCDSAYLTISLLDIDEKAPTALITCAQ